MGIPNYLLSPLDFERVASKLLRWSPKSLDVVRSVLVDGISLGKVAKTNSMSPQQVNVIRKRFLEKVEKDRIESFMSREKPENKTVNLNPYMKEIKMLSDKGYTSKQIVLYLKEQGLVTTFRDVDNFLKQQQK